MHYLLMYDVVKDYVERRPFALTLINGGYHTVKFILIGLSYALLG